MFTFLQKYVFKVDDFFAKKKENFNWG